MGDKYRIFRYTKKEGMTPAGGKIEVSHGCNGVLHADLCVEIRRDDKGRAINGVFYPVEEKGPCDGTCIDADLGGFLHPFPPV